MTTLPLSSILQLIWSAPHNPQPHRQHTTISPEHDRRWKQVFAAAGITLTKREACSMSMKSVIAHGQYSPKPVTPMLNDILWAIAMIRARRYRKALPYSLRQRFDMNMQPLTHSQCLIAYPDAFYHASAGDVSRAITTCRLLTHSSDDHE